MEEKRRKSGWGLFVLGTVIGILIGMVITCIVYRGALIPKKDSVVDQRVLSKIDRITGIIDEKFYLSEVTDEQLENGIYRGLLEALDDPYSQYYTEEDLADLLESSSGVFYGIGAYVSLHSETKLPTISSVMPNTPAEESGLRKDDQVYMIDGTQTYGLTLTEATKLIKGPEGTNVHLTIIREGEFDYVELDIVRRRVETPTVINEMFDDGMAYIQVREFDDVTESQFAQALEESRSNGMKGLIIDLRANPGGNLSTVVEMLRMILPEGIIVYTETKAGRSEEFFCDGKNQLEVPLVVLTDGNSASASEIFAGAVQDYGIGTLVGTTTYGKGIVQQIVTMEDGTALKTTISAYFTPKGRNIHGIGIEPDVECKFDAEKFYDETNPSDNQLEKAKEVLGELMK